MTDLVEENRLDVTPLVLTPITETKPLPFKALVALANKPPGTYGAAPAQVADSKMTLASLEEVGIGSNSSGLKETVTQTNQFTVQTTKLMEAKTRYFPYYEEESVLWSSRETESLKYASSLVLSLGC